MLEVGNIQKNEGNKYNKIKDLPIILDELRIMVSLVVLPHIPI